MFYKNVRKKSFSDEDEESDLIINNDEFCTVNENKAIDENLLKQNKNQHNYTEQKKNNNTNNRIFLKNPKIPKLIGDKLSTKDNNNIININTDKNNKINNSEEKTIFSKITEDLYLDSLKNMKPKKNIFDLHRKTDDNYNKLTVENYLFTCADKENFKNKKIIDEFIERKNKEQLCKKIAIKKHNNNNLEINEKQFSSEHKKTTKPKGTSRSPEQFLDDQKIMEIKHKNYMDNLIKIHNQEINLCIKDRPTISKQSEKLANLIKNDNKDIHLKLYEEFNKRKKNKEEKNKEEKNKNNFIISEYESILNKKIDNEQIIECAKRLYNEYEKKKNAINENEIKKLNDIKNLSSNSLISKNSNDIISKRFLNLYRNSLNLLFKKNISDAFDFAFGDFLAFIYKIGMVSKDYNNEQIEREKFKRILMNVNINPEIIKIENNDNNIKNIKTEIKPYSFKKNEDKNIKSKIEYSYKVLKMNTFLKGKSAGKKKNNNNTVIINENEKEYKLVKEAWKIITKNKSFNGEIIAPSKNVFLFFLSLCGIYKGDINTIFIKKELPFLLNDKSGLFNMETAKHIYKYFSLFRKSIIGNSIDKNKPQKKDSEIRNIELKKLEKNSKSFVKKSFNTSYNKNRVIYNKRNKKVFYIVKNKTGYRSCFNIKNKLNSNSYTYSEKEILNDNSYNIKSKRKNKIIKNFNKNNAHRIRNLESARYKNKLLKNNYKISKTSNNSLNEQKLKKNSKKASQKHISNSSFNSNSLFSQNNYEPQLNKNKSNNSNNSNNNDKSNNGGGHNKEKKSSISQYIFNEDYRIKDDIESNSNYNDNEINKDKNKEQNNNVNNINDKIEDNNNIINNKEINSTENNIQNIKKSSIEHLNNTNKNENSGPAGTKKKKYIFKIKIRDELIKLVIHKDDDVLDKINEFCKDNNLDEDDKEQIIEAVNDKLLGTN